MSLVIFLEKQGTCQSNMFHFSCVYPYFSGIPKVKWITFRDASHCTNLEIPDKYNAAVAEFLQNPML